MLETLVILLGFQLLGEAITYALHWPIPGPVLGMVLLFVFLCWRKAVPEFLERDVPHLLFYLPLLFVPAGVGVIQFLGLLQQHAFALGFVLLAATLITLVFSAALLRFLWNRQRLQRIQEGRGGRLL